MTGLTQGKIGLISAALILVIGWTCMIPIYYFIQPFPSYLFLIPPLCSLAVYMAVLIMVEYFILRKIRILYRTASSVGKIQWKDSLQDPELFEKLRLQVVQYASEKSGEINRLKENEAFRKEFIGNVSHELKTPLFSIQGFTEILLNEDLSLSETRSYLNKIYKNTERLASIIDDLLIITKAENNQLDLKKEKFRIYELVLEVIDHLEARAIEKKIDISIKDKSNIHYTVFADRFRISQVLFNLIENAIMYNPERTKVSIRFYDLDNQVLVEIRDQGVGIDKKHLNRIFERFYRVDEDRNRNKGGSGLGLSIVKKILEAHGQNITVESEPEWGTIFRFTLDK